LGATVEVEAGMERFVHRRNIEHYRQLLQSGQLEESQRQIVLKLLADEMAAERNEPTQKKE
jgi:hypothetical protein